MFIIIIFLDHNGKFIRTFRCCYGRHHSRIDTSHCIHGNRPLERLRIYSINTCEYYLVIEFLEINKFEDKFM